MSGIKISELPLASEPLEGIEFLVGVQNGETKKVTTGGIADIAAGKATEAAYDYTVAAAASAADAQDAADQTAADRVQTGLDREAAANYAAATGSDRTAVAADKATVAADKDTAVDAAAVASDKADIATTQAAAATSQAGIATTKASEASAAKTAAETARDQAVTAKTAAETASGTATTKASEAAGSASTAQAVLTNPDFIRVAAGVFPPRVVDIADGTSITMNAATTDIARQDNTQSAGILTINAPTGTPYVGQKLVLRIKSTNIQTLSWNSVFAGSDDLPLPVATSGSGKMDYYGFLYSTTSSKWQLLGKIGGF